VEAQPSFEFSRDLPIRARLVRFAVDDHLLLITVHHIASDGWSKAVLFRELEHFYAAALNGREPDLRRCRFSMSTLLLGSVPTWKGSTAKNCWRTGKIV
jgi:hypothetical protein